MRPYQFVPSPSEHGLVQVIREARDVLFIATPYIKDYGIQVILDHTRAKNVRLLTNLDIANITGSGFDLSALLKLWDRFQVQISGLSKLHAKVYVADSQVALVTSANLTHGGLRDNYEYGVILRDEQVVASMLDDMTTYFNLGNQFSRETIEQIRGDVEEIRDLRRGIERRAEVKQLRRVLTQKENALQTTILANRIKEGRTINSIFAETIEYLLKARGPLSTRDLHPLIQSIHPDICDDAVDRVINGQHFGKKWKHLARNAQQYLKHAGIIEIHDGKWYLTKSPSY